LNLPRKLSGAAEVEYRLSQSCAADAASAMIERCQHRPRRCPDSGLDTLPTAFAADMPSPAASN